MFNQKSETEEFQIWLQKRMEEAEVSPSEVAEFTRWLMSHSCNHSEKKHKDSSVSFCDVFELVSWMTGGMSQFFVREEERSEFSGWLKDRLKSHSCLTDDELHQVLEKLSRDE